MFRLSAWATCFALTPAAATAQTLGQGDASDVSVWRIVFSLILLICFSAAAFFVVKLKGGPIRLWQDGSDKRLKVIEIVRLSPQSMLCLAALDEKEVLIAITQGGATVISIDSEPTISAAA